MMMSTGCPKDNMSIQLEDDVLAAVDNFMYLGNNQ